MGSGGGKWDFTDARAFREVMNGSAMRCAVAGARALTRGFPAGGIPR